MRGFYHVCGSPALYNSLRLRAWPRTRENETMFWWKTFTRILFIIDDNSLFRHTNRATIRTNRSTINDRLNTIGRLLEESGGRRRDATARSIHRSIRDASRLDVEQPDASGRDRATKAQPRSARTRQRTTDRYPHPQLGFK